MDWRVEPQPILPASGSDSATEDSAAVCLPTCTTSHLAQPHLRPTARPAGLLSQAVEQLANSERCEGWCEGLHALVPGRSAGLPCLFRIFQRSSQCEQGAIGEENTSTVKFWAREHAPMRTTARPLQGASGTTDARQKWCYIGQESTVVATTG